MMLFVLDECSHNVERKHSHRMCICIIKHETQRSEIVFFKCSVECLLCHIVVKLNSCQPAAVNKKLATFAPPPRSSDWSTVLDLTLMSSASCKS